MKTPVLKHSLIVLMELTEALQKCLHHGFQFVVVSRLVLPVCCRLVGSGKSRTETVWRHKAASLTDFTQVNNKLLLDDSGERWLWLFSLHCC